MSIYATLDDWEKPLNSGYVVTTKLSWELGNIGSGLWLHVPVGFVFDVSIPRFLRWLFNPQDERYRKAAALHDYALFLGYNRISAASLFWAALKVRDDVGGVERTVMTLGVILWRWS